MIISVLFHENLYKYYVLLLKNFALLLTNALILYILELKYAAVTKRVQYFAHRNLYNVLHRKEDSNDKESIQSNTTRYSRHHKEM